jgi:two-component system nitrate/nitrite response regulator NarL
MILVMEEPIHILIIEDHTLLRESIAAILTHEPGFKVVGEGATAEDAIWLAHELQPDVILLDMDMPVNGIAIAHAINLHSPETHFVYLTVSDGDDRLIRPLASGGRAFILRNVGSADLFRIIKAAFSGKNLVPASLAADLLAEKKAEESTAGDGAQTSLSDLEGKILEDLAAGLSSRRIGQELNISRRAVNHSVARIINKLQMRTRSDKALASRYSRKASSKSYLAIEIGRK